MSTVPGLFRRLVDDAAVFPPGNAPLDHAALAHATHRAAPYGAVVGRFLCRASELGQLRLPPDAPLGVIADRGLRHALAAITATDHHPDVVEYALDPARPLAEQVHARIDGPLRPRDTFVEIPLQRGWRDAVRACAHAGVGAKLRTGGLTAYAFPDPHDVAAFVDTCVLHAVPFKCTAGLHRAVRHVERGTGFNSHGFLNVLVATHAAITGGDALAAMEARDPADLAAVCWGVDDAAAGAVRRSFTGFGSCSIDEPLADLVALGLLPRDVAPERAESRS